MLKFGRHEVRFMAMFVLIMSNIVITCIFGMAANSAVEAGQTAIVSHGLIDGWGWFSIFASPFIMLAGMLPAGKDDLLRWN